MSEIESPVRFVGSYDVTGRTPGGAAYRGTLRLAARGPFLDGVATIEPAAGASQGAERFGLAMEFGGRLVMAFGPRDKVEIGAYRIAGGQASGLWVPPGVDTLDKCGREQSVAEGSSFRITRAVSIDGSEYTGKVTMTPAEGADAADRPTPLRLAWNLHDGDYGSFGLGYDDAVYTTFCFEPEQPHGVAVYEPAADGTLRGRWIGSGEMKLGEETLVRSST